MLRFLFGLILGSVAGWLAKERVQRPSWQQVVNSDKLKVELAQANATIARLETQLAAQQTQLPAPAASKQKDDLTKITGIGPAFAKRLYAAKVNTFTELAKLSPEQVRSIIAPKEWQKVDCESWISQAKALAS